MSTLLKAPITFGTGALEELQRLTQEPDYNPEEFLRIGVKGGGCSGLTYVLGFDKKEEGDDVYDIEGVKVIIKPQHLLYLHAMEVTFSNGLNARGFEFKNPNASSTCGCGTSFAV